MRDLIINNSLLDKLQSKNQGVKVGLKKNITEKKLTGLKGRVSMHGIQAMIPEPKGLSLLFKRRSKRDFEYILESLESRALD
ncbi:hypothetical protein BB561_006021 [Smittium simulii]|uniref:Uncharacterized protein n=1 Tax=Smittium simulii TaxID=133385 RepID=A0A2T9Y6Z4_9FUNG|nr:hypothetical protein BB561_006021 [Smittium simulii]